MYNNNYNYNPYMSAQQSTRQNMDQQYMNYGQPIGQIQPVQQIQPIQNLYRTPSGLQGKVVDSLDVVKATEIPLDGSISYYPLADNSMIVTKQLGIDGKTKTILYKQVEEEKIEQNLPKYVTIDELNAKISELDFKDIKLLKDEVKSIKRGLEDVTDSLKEKKGK